MEAMGLQIAKDTRCTIASRVHGLSNAIRTTVNVFMDRVNLPCIGGRDFGIVIKKCLLSNCVFYLPL